MNRNFIALWILFIALFASPVSATTISIIWEPSPSEEVVGYSVYYGHKSGEYPTRIDTASQTSCTLQPKAGSNYYFVVTAYTAAGLESLPSGEVAYEPNPDVLESAGTFNGLFDVVPSQRSLGHFTLKKGSGKSFSGSVRLEGRVYGFSGKPDSSGMVNISIKRFGTTPLILTLNTGSSEQYRLTGTLTDGNWVMQLTADRAIFNSRTNAAPYAGKYTVAIAGILGEDLTPGGMGFASVKVLPNGLVQARGVLGDGKNFVSSSYISKDGIWPFYVAAYGRFAGLISGWLKFETNEADSVHGDLNWIKPTIARDKFYAVGFSNSVAAIGSTYVPPSHPTNAILDISNGTVTLSGGELVQGLTKEVMLLNNKIISVPAGMEKLSFNIQKDVGLFSGSIQVPGYAARVRFRGGLLQNRNAGYGLFVGTNQTGQFLLESTP